MLKRITSQTIKKHGMLSPGDAVLVCVSGGPDSVCLLHLLHSMKEKYALKLSVCHIDHMLRKKESSADAEFTEELAKKKNLPFFASRKNVRLRAERQGLSIEEAGRRIRYEFFEKTAKKHNINKIALGHNMDDRAETLLLNLMRGSGLDGMAGIPPERKIAGTNIRVIRPLIEAPRSEIEAYLEKGKNPFRVDSSNSESVYTRNRLRLELIPYIESSFEPGIKQKLAKTAAMLDEHRSYFRLSTRKTLKEIIKTGEGSAEIKVEELRRLHPAIRRAALQEAFSFAGKDSALLSSAHIEQLNAISESASPRGKLNLPSGISAEREYERLIFRKSAPGAKAPGTPRPIKIPGRNFVPELGISIEFKVTRAAAVCLGEKNAAALDFEKIKLPAVIRGRKAGDRFSPLGMTGTRKLKNFLIDKKIPMRERDALPVIADSGDNILCVLLPGGRRAAIDNKYRITDGTKQALKVRIV